MPATLKEGTRLGSYEILRPLGSGGMGEVYLARDMRLDRQVAIKIITARFSDVPDRLERFLREAKTASSLNHPNIAHVYEIGEAEGLHYIVMEYVRGEPLTSRVGPRGMPIADVIVFATQMADALDEAHSHGIIHRDLKPANAMISARRKLKILDFGLAKVVGPASDQASQSTMAGDTMAGMVLGTLDYMSPEQVRGLELDRRSDIFSFGVMLYEMITGRLPFASTSKTDTVYRITQVQPEALNRYNYEVPADLERIVRKCLEKEPDRRYQSVRELLVDLSSLRRDSSGVTLPPPAAGLSRPRRNQAVVVAALVLLSAGAVAGAWAWLRNDVDVIDSIAVVPDMSTSAGQQAMDLAEGVAATLANSLSQLPDLNVAPRQLAATRGENRSALEIARELNAHAVLTVRVVLRGDTAAVSLNLIDVDHPKQLWGVQYSRRLEEIELAQQSVPEEVADTLRLRLNADDKRDQEVYQLYQRGRYHAGKRTEVDLRKAVDFYDQAIRKNRNYAPAFAGLADVYNLLPIYGGMSPRDAASRAKGAAERALELEETLAEAHTALGLVFFRSEWDWPAAEREFGRAMALNPNDAEARHWAGLFLTAMGRFDESITRVREGQAINPLSPLLRADPGWIFFMARQYELGVKASQAAVLADPKSLMPHRYLGLAQTQLRSFDRAISAFQTAVLLSGSQTSLHQAELAHAYSAAGRRADATRVLSDLTARRGTTYVSPYSLAVLATGIEQVESALEWLDTALRERDPLVVWAKVDPRLDPLRSQARFAAALRTLGLE